MLCKLISINLKKAAIEFEHLLEKHQTATIICSLQYFANTAYFNGAHYHDHNHSRQHGKGLQGVCPHNCPKSTLEDNVLITFVMHFFGNMTYNACVENANRRRQSGDEVNVYTSD